MKTEDAERRGEEACGSVCKKCAHFTQLPRETLRDLMAVVARQVLDRKAKEICNFVYVEAPNIPIEASVVISVDLLLVLLRSLVKLRREMELDHLSWQYNHNHQYRKLCNQTAAIISRTYVELGDGAVFTDDEALLMIRDLLLKVDSTIISRNRFRRITKKDKSGFGFGNK